MANLGNPWVNLPSWQLAAFSRLGTLGHLDLQFTGLDQVKARYAKPPGGDLLDGAILRIATRHWFVALRIFTAFAGIALAANPVHGNGQALVGFLADRAVRHRAGFETEQNRIDRFDFF